MNDNNPRDDQGRDGAEALCEQLARLLEGASVEEWKKNSRAAASAILAKLNVVGREEFDAHCEMLSRAIVRMKEMEEKIACLEKEKTPAKEKAANAAQADKETSKTAASKSAKSAKTDSSAASKSAKSK